MKLSFILPIFNTGKYLKKCIDSVLAQNLTVGDYEILLVYDEGSSDNSLQVAQENADKYPNAVRLISHSNRSIGESLNYAFPLAKGEYVQVIDTDDYLEPNTMAPLIDRLYAENLDILRFKFQNVNEEYKLINHNKDPYQGMNFRDTVTDGLDFLIHRMGYACYVPTMIFRQELLLRPGNEMLTIAINDAEWLPRIVVQANRVSSVDTILYNYLIRNTSKMHSGREVFIVDETLKVFEAYRPYMDGSAKQWYKMSMAYGTISILSRIVKQSYKIRKHYIDILKSYNVFPIKLPFSTKTTKLYCKIINVSPMLYCWLMRLKAKIRKK